MQCKARQRGLKEIVGWDRMLIVASATCQQKVANLHAVELVDILEELAARVILEQVLALLILVALFGNSWVYAIMLP